MLSYKRASEIDLPEIFQIESKNQLFPQTIEQFEKYLSIPFEIYILQDKTRIIGFLVLQKYFQNVSF